MNAFKSIDDILYEVTADEVVLRKRNIIVPLLILLAGVALAVWGVTVPAMKESVTLSSVFTITGISIAVIGIARIVVVAGPKGRVPVDKKTGERLRRHELYYDGKDKAKLCNALSMGDLQSVSLLSRSSTSNVLLTLYCTPSGSVAVAQVSHYVPHNFEPVTDVYKFAGNQGGYVSAILA